MDTAWTVLRPARAVAAIGAVSCLAMAYLTWRMTEGWMAYGTLAFIAILGGWEWRRVMRLDRSEATAFRLMPNEPGDDAAAVLRISLRFAVDDRIGTVQVGAFVASWLTTIPYVLDGDPSWRRLMPRVLAITPDAIDGEAFRRLRVELRWRMPSAL